MAVDTLPGGVLVAEAEMIVQAEWLRACREEERREREVIESLAEEPAGRKPRPPRVMAAAVPDWPDGRRPRKPARRWLSRCRAGTVWATQRSPPGRLRRSVYPPKSRSR